jgi:hypothetical protein
VNPGSVLERVSGLAPVFLAVAADMNPHLELYFRLPETERELIRSAAREKSWLAFSVFKTHFPGLSAQDMRLLMVEIDRLPR